MAPSAIQIADVLGSGGSLRAPEPTRGYAALLDICRELQAVEGELDDVLTLIVEKAVEILGSDLAWLVLRDEASGTLRMSATRGVQNPAFAALELLAPEATIAGAASAARQTVVVTDYEAHARDVPEPMHSAMLGEGLRSLVCAPMLLDDTLVGALYVGMRTPTTFGSAHASMLTTLAEHGSIAIHNARLLRELASHNDVLEQSFEIHRTVTSVGLRDAGASGVVDALARVLRRRIAVEPDAAVGLSERIDSAAEAAESGGAEAAEPAGCAPILARDERLGEIVAYGEPLSELEQRALEHGATVLAAELLRRRSAREAEWRLQGDLLEELIDAAAPLPESLRLRAAHVGVDLRCERHVVVIELGESHAADGRLLPAVRTLAGRHAIGLGRGPALAFQRGGRIVAEVPAGPEPWIDALATRLEAELIAAGAGGASIGIGSASHDLRAAHREALACARLAAPAPAGSCTVSAASLAPFDSLFDAASFAQAEAMARTYLGRLAEHDRSGRVPLLETVKAFVDAGGHVATAAKVCFVHPTTLKYRLGLAADHVHGPLDDLAVRFELRVAFQVLSVLRALGSDPLRQPGRGAAPHEAASA